MVASAWTLGRFGLARAARGPPRRSCRRGARRTAPRGLIWSNASMRPLATSSQRVMPPKMLNSTAVTFSLERITSTALRDRLGVGAAAGVEEVRRLAARVLDDVQRAHDQAGAVAEDADVAVELDVGEVPLAGHLLLRVLVGHVAQRRVVRMAEQRVVVERDLGVERRDLAVGGDDQRVDLDERRVLGDEGVVELAQQRADRADDVGVDAGVEGEPAAVEVLEAEQRVDVQAGDRVRVALGHLLDVHAALGGEHDQRLLGRAVEDDRRVVLRGDVGGRLHPHLVDGEAADVHADDVRGVLLGLVAVLGDLDAAGLAAAADLHLRLDHARVADLLGGRDGLADRGRGLARGDRDTVASEQLLALVFE